ncbi:hypothetical protein [Pseudomonas sp. NPDC089401]|uniref:hypothetical protein n=1 Tax=Pseudomonas sp. NPDC089401 TaxID=3364462 RepID=UPI0038201BFE
MRLQLENQLQNEVKFSSLQPYSTRVAILALEPILTSIYLLKCDRFPMEFIAMSLKDPAELNNQIQQFNVLQAAVVARGQDLLKTLLLLSGGALAVCANFFSAKVELPPSTVAPVQLAWAFLTAAIILFGTSLTLLLGRDYLFGEIVRRQLEEWKKGRPDPDEPELSKKWDYGIWGAGLLGLLCFILGMSCFTSAAWRFLNEQIPLIG